MTPVTTLILQYLENHPQATDTIEGIARWWIRSSSTPLSMDALSRALDALIEQGDVQVVATGGARLYRVTKPLEVRFDGQELGRLATRLKTESSGRTLVVLAGGSAEQKTLAVEKLTATSGLNLYRVDLRVVISKFIGETEKNLDRVFVQAMSSDAAVFFDEADALFVKRAEVDDSHDRYANPETTLLLRRVDAFTGLVIIAFDDLEAARVIARRTRRERSVVVWMQPLLNQSDRTSART